MHITSLMRPRSIYVIVPQALGDLSSARKVLLVNLSRQQIEDSPSISEHKPVMRHHEEEYHRYYGYGYYAEKLPSWGSGGYPVIVPPPLPDVNSTGVDSHLRSAREVKGFTVEARDGTIGEVTDLLIDSSTWIIREIGVECGHWYAGKSVFVSTGRVSRVDYNRSTVHVNETKQASTEDSNLGRRFRPIARKSAREHGVELRE